MKSILRLPLIFWFFGTLLIYSSVLISPQLFKYSGVISFGVPIVIVLNLIYLILSIVFKWKSGLVALVLLLAAYPFIEIGIGFSRPKEGSADSFKVLNYNIKRYHLPKSDDDRIALANWILESDADVICLQEFAYGSIYSKTLKSSSKYRTHFGGYANSFAILSKFPIISSGQMFQDDHANNVIYVDLKIKSDTIRVYNIHLESMGIDPEKIQSTEGIKREYESITKKFLSANQERSRQVELLIEGADTIKYPKLLVGDFNDVPFSYNYFQFRSKFKNAFEEAGSGFGITYNGKIPFLRIDNQFYSDGIKALSLETINNVYYSDHFPLIGNYEITR